MLSHVKCLISPFLKLEFDLGWYGVTAMPVIRADSTRHIIALIFKTINKSYEHPTMHVGHPVAASTLPLGVSTNYFFA